MRNAPDIEEPEQNAHGHQGDDDEGDCDRRSPGELEDIDLALNQPCQHGTLGAADGALGEEFSQTKNHDEQ